MYSILEVEQQVDNLLNEKFFSGIRKIIVEEQKQKFLRTTEYIQASDSQKKELLKTNYKVWFDSIGSFFLSLKAIRSLQLLVLREISIREFSSEEIMRVKVDYVYNDIGFSLYYPTLFRKSTIREMEDCISDLIDEKHSHIVDNFIAKTDTERTPHEPITTAELKYSAFYLFGFEPEYVTALAQKLFNAKLITNPQTNGWKIEDSVVEDIITLLSSKYPEEKILQHKRIYIDRYIDRYENESIRPIHIATNYFPKFVEETQEFMSIKKENPTESRNLIQLYEFIFYMTLSTQMKNSIYDTSSIEVSVGNRKLKEVANVLIEGEDNWELLTGSILKKIHKNSEDYKKQTIVLPIIAPEEILKPLNVQEYSYQSKRPPRYGIGRFVTQILENFSIGSNNEHDKIIKELTDSKAIRIIRTMIHPQENSVILINWITQYMPSILDLEYLKDLYEKMALVSDGSFPLESVLKEIERIIEAAFELSGFKFEDEAPSESKIKLLKAIAKKNNITLDESIYQSNIKIDMILAQYPVAEPIKIGSCPQCNSLVFQKEFIKQDTGEVLYYFACEKYGTKSNDCTFSIWDNYIHKFFSDKAIELFTVEERANTLKKIMSKKKGYLFTDFIAKNQKPYDAKVSLDSYEDKNSKQKKWNFSLEFVNKK